MNSQSKASAICSDTISSQHGRYTDTTIQSLRNCGRGEKNSVLSMFGHTSEEIRQQLLLREKLAGNRELLF